MISIPVETRSASYQVHLHEGAFEPLTSYLEEKGFRAFFLVDAQVYRYHTDGVHDLTGFNKGVFRTLIMKPSEKMKTMASVNRILSFLQDHGADRKSVLVIIGGGIIGDIGSFAASVYMRGIRFIQVPTTLLSVIDSSVGGKTGVNFGGRKNFVGTFNQPESVWSGHSLLMTLPRAEWESGYGEMVKYAFLYDRQFFERVAGFFRLKGSARQEELNSIMAECIAIKARIVAADETETGPRKLLNLGHTFAHAIESATSFKVKHGVAVSAGLICAAELSVVQGMLSRKTADEYISLCRVISFPKILSRIDPAELWELMQSDKKSSNGEVRFVLLREGEPPAYDIPVNEKIVSQAIKNSLHWFE